MALPTLRQRGPGGHPIQGFAAQMMATAGHHHMPPPPGGPQPSSSTDEPEIDINEYVVGTTHAIDGKDVNGGAGAGAGTPTRSTATIEDITDEDKSNHKTTIASPSTSTAASASSSSSPKPKPAVTKTLPGTATPATAAATATTRGVRSAPPPPMMQQMPPPNGGPMRGIPNFMNPQQWPPGVAYPPGFANMQQGQRPPQIHSDMFGPPVMPVRPPCSNRVRFFLIGLLSIALVAIVALVIVPSLTTNGSSSSSSSRSSYASRSLSSSSAFAAGSASDDIIGYGHAQRWNQESDAFIQTSVGMPMVVMAMAPLSKEYCPGCASTTILRLTTPHPLMSTKEWRQESEIRILPKTELVLHTAIVCVNPSVMAKHNVRVVPSFTDAEVKSGSNFCRKHSVYTSDTTVWDWSHDLYLSRSKWTPVQQLSQSSGGSSMGNIGPLVRQLEQVMRYQVCADPRVIEYFIQKGLSPCDGSLGKLDVITDENRDELLQVARSEPWMLQLLSTPWPISDDVMTEYYNKPPLPILRLATRQQQQAFLTRTVV